MIRLKQLILYPSLILLSIGLWVFLWLEGVLNGLEGEAMRWRYLVRGELISTAPIVYVDMDADAVSYIGAPPWETSHAAGSSCLSASAWMKHSKRAAI